MIRSFCVLAVSAVLLSAGALVGAALSAGIGSESTLGAASSTASFRPSCGGRLRGSSAAPFAELVTGSSSSEKASASPPLEGPA